MAERFYSQRLTNKLLVTMDATLYLTKEKLNLWASRNSSGLSILGSMYIFKDSTKFINAVTDLWTNPNFPAIDYWGTTHLTLNSIVQDMGKDIFIGIPAETSLVRMRLIQLPTPSTALGRGGQVAYVFTQVNSSDVGPDALLGPSSASGITVGVVPC
jgi:hypothetical protein